MLAYFLIPMVEGEYQLLIYPFAHQPYQQFEHSPQKGTNQCRIQYRQFSF